jgi:hypothetical protein
MSNIRIGANERLVADCAKCKVQVRVKLVWAPKKRNWREFDLKAKCPHCDHTISRAKGVAKKVGKLPPLPDISNQIDMFPEVAQE